MNPTVTKLAQVYRPMIKFIGKREALIDVLKLHNNETTKPHPCTIDGLLPGSKDCLSVDQIISKQLPFKVIPYVNKNTKIESTGNNSFIARELKEGELSSIFELPKKYQFKPIDEGEIDYINNGGAL